MADHTAIEWADATWNPITGCTKISPACDHCYAERMARRLAGRYGYPQAPYHFDVTFHPEQLEKLSEWKRPRRVFVVSMGDLFHLNVRRQWGEHALAAMLGAPQHTYMLLTKRPRRAEAILSRYIDARDWPELPANWWVGATVENQTAAKARIPVLLRIPAAHHWVSVEPLLEPIDLSPWLAELDGVALGAETGPGKRTMDLGWARPVRDQCLAAGVAFTFKKDSAGSPLLDGRTWQEFPA